jgi:Mrp family chromosome partitioning ATPase
MVAVDQETGMHYVTGVRHEERNFGVGSLRHLENFLAGVQDSYDLVIIDSAPVVCAPEALSICQMTDGVIFIVRWGHTPYRYVRHAVGMLQRVKANVLGAVVTRANVRRHSTYAFGDVGEVYRRHGKYYSA